LVDTFSLSILNNYA